MTELAPVRLGFAFGAGMVTFFAPCAFPLLPGYVAFYLGNDDDAAAGTPRLARLRRAAAVGVVTSLGFFLVYGALAGVALAAGRQLLQQVSVLELVVGSLLVVLGAGMLTGRFDPGAVHVRLPERRRGPAGYFLFGVAYAAAAAGCTAPVFVGIAAVALTAPPAGAVLTLGAYAAGMSVLMVVVTVLAALGRATVLRRVGASSGRLTRLAGAVLVLAGLVQIYYYLVVFDGLAVLL